MPPTVSNIATRPELQLVAQVHKSRPSRDEDNEVMEEQETLKRFSNDPILRLAFKEGCLSGLLHLSYFQLTTFPGKLLVQHSANLVRLDLGHNELASIPGEISLLTKLEQLWLNGNRELRVLPKGLSSCSKLRVLDLRDTAVESLPLGLGILPDLVCIELQGVETLNENLHNAYFYAPVNEGELLLAASNEQPNVEDATEGQEGQQEDDEAEEFEERGENTELNDGEEEENRELVEASEDEGTPVEVEDPARALSRLAAEKESMAVKTKRVKLLLKREHEINSLKEKLEEKFKEGLYRDMWEVEGGREQVIGFIEVVFSNFEDFADLREIVRNCDRLFPEKFSVQCIPKMKQRFFSLKQQNERKKLAAKLELKIRAIYYDRINPASVEGIVKSIYAEIASLSDIKFLLFYASQLFPEHVEDINAHQLYQNLRSLQRQLKEQRDAAIELVTKAAKLLYSHVEPQQVEVLVKMVCKHFKKVDEIKKLAADASLYFPAEFENALTAPDSVRQTFEVNEEAGS